MKLQQHGFYVEGQHDVLPGWALLPRRGSFMRSRVLHTACTVRSRIVCNGSKVGEHSAFLQK